MIFTGGNLLSLGIVGLAFILYHQLTRRSRTLDKVREYGKRLREELAVFVAEKESAVKDYGIELEVQQTAAKELLKRLVITDEELADKAAAMAKIDERISSYDSSLEELVRMTALVQENLNRIKEESAFVENAAKRVSQAEDKLRMVEKDLGDMEARFERDNAGALEKAAERVLASANSLVSDLRSEAETIERKVGDHREAVDQAEKQRADSLARDLEIINNALKEAVGRAGARADKVEEAALVKLREQALERVQRFQTAVEEKLKTYQESAKTRVSETQGLLKSFKDEWKAEYAEIEGKQRGYKDEWKKDIAELNALAREQRATWKLSAEEEARQNRELLAALKNTAVEAREHIGAEIAALEERFQDIERRSAESSTNLEKMLLKSTEEAEQRALEVADARLEEYRQVQAQQYQHLDSLADDTTRLEDELRRAMQDAENRVRADFALFEQDSSQERQGAALAFTSAVEALKADLGTVEQELAALKSRAYENVSEKLQVFEDDFAEDLSRRGEAIDRQFEEWKAGLDGNLETLAEDAETKRRALETSFAEQVRSQFAAQNDRLLSELEHLKAETSAFEEGIRDKMDRGDQSLRSFKEQLDGDLEEARGVAETSVKAELGRFALSMADNLKQAQRDLAGSLREITEQVEERSGELLGLQDASRRELEEWQAKVTAQIRDADTQMDEVRRRTRELATENNERLAGVRSAIDDVHTEADTSRQEIFARIDEQAQQLNSVIKEADRHIKEFITQTKLFEQTDALKLNLEQRIEDLRGDLDRLDQRRVEAAELETQFVKIKRLEEEVNAKMNSFMAEKRRIELMETDFNRLLETSQSVKEKLVQLSDSDDTLQAIQVQIRRLNDAMAETEDKYQRIEKKNQTLETTNAGIDRNFKVLQETEADLKQAQGNMRRLREEQETLRASVEKLSTENEQVRETAEKLSALDGELEDIEGRIKQMQVAREWLARTETRLAELDKELQDRVKLVGTILKDEGGAAPRSSKGAPPIGTRENVVKLSRQGWTVDEIARSLKLAKGEVELIIEMGPKG
jgi:chromosome segregation ATPase